MDSHLNEVKDEKSCENTCKTSSAEEHSSEVMDKSIDNKSNEDNDKNVLTKQLLQKSGSEENSKYKTVGSRYKQSAQDWPNRRADNSHNSQDMSTNVNRSRNPSPISKIKAQKASTPVSTAKSFNCSDFSVINKVNEMKPEMKIKRYGKGLTTGRQSLAFRRLPFGTDSDSNPSGGQSSRPTPMSVTHESQTKNKEIENSLNTSVFLQTIYMNLKAKQMRTDRKTNAFNKITQIWIQTNELKTKLLETQKSFDFLQHSMDSLEILDKQKTILKQHSDMRAETDRLFNTLSELIAEQKVLLKLENCTQNDFEKLNDLMEISQNIKNLGTFGKLSNASKDIQNSNNILVEIKSFENEFKEYFNSFVKIAKNLEKYERIENSLVPQKSLSLKKLF